MPRPRVLVDLLSYTGTKGGMETYTRELYRLFGEMETGLEFVGLASKEGGRLDLSWFPGELIRSRISGENRFVWAAGELVATSLVASRRRADLLHSPATLGPMKTTMPAVLTIHDTLYWSHPELMSTPFYTGPVKWMETRAARNAAHVITDSEASAVDIRKYLHVPPDRLHVVPLAATPVPDRVAATPPTGDVTLLASGQRRPHKNWEGLIEALARIEPADRPRLVITGGRGADPLQPVVDRLGLGEHVELRGWVSEDELNALYREATAMVLPSFVEGFGLPVLEALQAGVPVLCSDIAAHREIAGDAAVWFDPHDGASIAAAVRTVDDGPGADGAAAGRGARAGPAVLVAARRRRDARGLPDGAARDALSPGRRTPDQSPRTRRRARRRCGRPRPCACRERPAAGSGRAGGTSTADGPRAAPGPSRGPPSGGRRSRSSAARRADVVP